MNNIANVFNVLSELVKSVNEMRIILTKMYEQTQQTVSDDNDGFLPIHMLPESNGKYPLNNE